MTEQEHKAKFKQAIDHTLSGLEGDPYLFQRVAANAEKGANHMKYHFPKGILITLIALLCMGTVAVAASVYGGTVNWMGEVVPDERVPAVLPTPAPATDNARVDWNEERMDELRKEGMKLLVWQQMSDGTLMPEISTSMFRTADSEAEFLALLEGDDEMALPNFIPEGYEFVQGEVVYKCRADGAWNLVEQQTVDEVFVAEWYTMDKADEVISGYYLLYRESPESNHYLSIYAGLSVRQDVEEQSFGFLAGQTPSVVQVPGMDHALAITSEDRCSLYMLRNMKQPVELLWLPEYEWLGSISYEQLDVTVSAPLLDVDTLIRMFAAE